MKTVKLIRHAWRNCHMRLNTEGYRTDSTSCISTGSMARSSRPIMIGSIESGDGRWKRFKQNA
jgi:hypothetical protein